MAFSQREQQDISDALTLALPPVASALPQDGGNDALCFYNSSSCDPAQFRSLLNLWWLQKLQYPDLCLLSKDNRSCLDRFVDRLEKHPSEEDSQKSTLEKHPSEEDSQKSTTVEGMWSDLSGFHQFRNGPCGLLAAVHALQVSKQMDGENPMSRRDALVAALTHMLVQAASTESAEGSDTKDSSPEEKIQATPHAVCLVTGGNLPVSLTVAQEQTVTESDTVSDHCVNAFAPSSLAGSFGFKLRRLGAPTHRTGSALNASPLPYHHPEALQAVDECLDEFAGEGGCLRLLLSLVLSRGVARVRHELREADSNVVFKLFRDESLIVPPLGFCSQNAVNLCLFGHARPKVLSREALTFPCGLLVKEPNCPAETGFVQEGDGHEFAFFPAWVVHSGMHYTSLFGFRQRDQGEYRRLVKVLQREVKFSNTPKKGQTNRLRAPDAQVTAGHPEPFLCHSGRLGEKEEFGGGEDGQVDSMKKDCSQKIDFSLFLYNGLPPGGPLLAPVRVSLDALGDSEDRDGRGSLEKREKQVRPEECIRWDGMFVKVHEVVQRLTVTHEGGAGAKGKKILYEVAVSLESQAVFEESKANVGCSPWLPSVSPGSPAAETERKTDALDPRTLPSGSTHAYPSKKWRCCGCYLGPDPTLRFEGYNDLGKDREALKCKCCGRVMRDSLRTLFVPYDLLPTSARQSVADRVEHPLASLLKRRFKKENLQVEVDSEFQFSI
uniref:Deubiquitinating enzyme MINDY-3/4 conserved domain-containing protein n=1 Tax=Chromera velia CCMP2878 TaxID=1169474 RepID=A0A0G4H7B5_9ALVE|eukprot:Cvel_24955.t1-p1 / transcript=Cvel_24955.t1 / gene=Cvel_24955 / organism=Chromera_velia_CCMP2878 / gene_product=hypothetical protein / transcript_product=hypothetical protein / location=Cvel_scaffold2763:13554-15713(+) / protein_length=720 / sequence_SO=supercontig / SO=protein_coding / is_pseudo=false